MTNEILRLVYLPPNLDNQLRIKAFRTGKLKSDIIREAVIKYFEKEKTNE